MAILGNFEIRYIRELFRYSGKEFSYVNRIIRSRDCKTKIFQKEVKKMDFIKKSMLLGLGIASLSKEKVEKLVDELIKKGEMAEKERPKVIDKLLKEAKKQEKEFIRKTSGIVQKVIEKMGLPTRKDFEKILKRLDGLEKKISKAKEKESE